MTIFNETVLVLDSVLALQGRGMKFDAGTPLLGALPELDSMAVVAILTGLEDHFGFQILDEEVDAELFRTVGSLVDFVQQKLIDSRAPT